MQPHGDGDACTLPPSVPFKEAEATLPACSIEQSDDLFVLAQTRATGAARGMDVQVVNGFHGGEYSSNGVHLMEQQGSFKNQQPKALKFVTNYGAPHPKRRRIAAACLTCTYLRTPL